MQGKFPFYMRFCAQIRPDGEIRAVFLSYRIKQLPARIYIEQGGKPRLGIGGTIWQLSE
jgi:hypothetical protein